MNYYYYYYYYYLLFKDACVEFLVLLLFVRVAGLFCFCFALLESCVDVLVKWFPTVGRMSPVRVRTAASCFLIAGHVATRMLVQTTNNKQQTTNNKQTNKQTTKQKQHKQTIKQQTNNKQQNNNNNKSNPSNKQPTKRQWVPFRNDFDRCGLSSVGASVMWLRLCCSGQICQFRVIFLLLFLLFFVCSCLWFSYYSVSILRMSSSI